MLNNDQIIKCANLEFGWKQKIKLAKANPIFIFPAYKDSSPLGLLELENHQFTTFIIKNGSGQNHNGW